MELIDMDPDVRPLKPVRISLTSRDSSTNRDSLLPESACNLGLPRALSGVSLSDLLGQDVTEEAFQAEVAHKTNTYFVGRQEAELEVVIDRLVKRQGTKEKALLFVVDEIPTEVKVQVMVNTLLHRGANPSYRGRDWQTPLHHATRRGFKGVVGKLLENDALPTARDRHDLMPLHLAFSAGDDDIAALLLAYMPNMEVRCLFFSQGDKEAELSLHQLIRRDMQRAVLAVLDCMVEPIGHQSGHVRVHYQVLEADEQGRAPNHPHHDPTSRSCLHLISKGGHKNLVNHNVVRLLIRRKWKEFARRRYMMNFALFLVTQVSLCFCAVLATMTPEPRNYSEPWDQARAVFEVWTVLAVSITFLLELNQMRKHRIEYFRDLFNWIEILSSSLLLSSAGLRWAGRGEQWYVFSLGFLLWTLRIFEYAAVVRQTGAYSQILWRVLAHDFPQFLVVFAVILLAFSGSFLLALRAEDSLQVHPETSTFWFILFAGVRILIEGETVVEYTGPQGYEPLSCILMVAFLFTCCVVLLNILIAQLSDTYQHVQHDAQRGLELNRAWIVARVELNALTPFSRQGFRQSLYRDVEVMQNPMEVLEKWESPPLNEMSKHVRDIWDSLESHKLHMLTIKDRISHHEYTLGNIQGQMDKMLDMMVQLTKDIPGQAEKTGKDTPLSQEQLSEGNGETPTFE